MQINAMSSGIAGTPNATKGTVSNHSISVTPSVTNTTGYITGGTLTGESVTVSPSELVSGTYSVTRSGTKDVTHYQLMFLQGLLVFLQQQRELLLIIRYQLNQKLKRQAVTQQLV